ncbi:DNA invertase Pin-like site-specific DNA recombinase [Peribacillus deserti]|uniref:DNA invertase Pin-like site-specific DNA recombinase n=1 Tax=Peribacillus deserti TaxID=673318 RepID=A0ABS2QGM9_9BACI|nr:DNA invertase Pin-like site-specific DNA recombinase [Peribacillus deserti]
MIYGYPCVSTPDQTLDTQIEALKNFGVNEIISKKVIGILKVKEKLEY